MQREEGKAMTKRLVGSTCLPGESMLFPRSTGFPTCGNLQALESAGRAEKQEAGTDRNVRATG